MPATASSCLGAAAWAGADGRHWDSDNAMMRERSEAECGRGLEEGTEKQHPDVLFSMLVMNLIHGLMYHLRN